MNYIWETALAADQSGIPREEITYRPARNGSPYAEVVLENLNSRTLESTVVEVNPLYRFAKEFAAVFDCNVEGLEKTRELLFDITMHYMVQADLRQGLSRQEYGMRFLLRDLLNGVCGRKTAEVATHFEKDKLRRLLVFIRKMYQCGSSITLFREVMRYMYPESLVYASNDETGEVLAYIGRKETAQERERIEFLQDMFLPIQFHLFIFWDRHFGIIDVEETMVLDEMVLF